MSGGRSDSPGDVIAGRYRLVARIGAGAHGEVWRAADSVTACDIALKVLVAGTELSLARVQLEVAALRQRLPGVVELFDDGIDDGRPFLAMDLIEGRPFPGREPPCPWSEIADVTISLLETLGHVHAASVIHRDLKPENVLVTEDRRVKLLDFGLVYRQSDASMERLTGRHEVLGTPAYIAPEQLRGAEISERSDLYALGVMLYVALSGHPPHHGRSVGELFFQRLNQRHVPLLHRAPGVPAAVAHVVERLLSVAPEDRPRSAFEVLALLRGEPAMATPHFPWLGSREPLHALTSAVRRSGSVDILGLPGSGRTRCLLALEEAVGEERAIRWTHPSDRAFASLSRIVGELDDQETASLAEVAIVVDARLREALGGGLVIIVDDAERVDRMSAEALSRCRDAGTIVRAYATGGDRPATSGEELAIRLAPLQEPDLERLFVGPNRLLHLREDAARILHERTGGIPARVTREVSTWVRLGIARWMEDLLVVQREGLEQLEMGLLAAAADEAEANALAALPSPLADALAWIALAWPHTHLAPLAGMMGEARFRLEDDVDELTARGLTCKLADGRVEPRAPGFPAERWSHERLRHAHQAIAAKIAPGETGRLHHMLLGALGSDETRLAVAREAAIVAERLIDRGALGQAAAAIESGLRSVRGVGDAAAPAVEWLLGLHVEAAVAKGTPNALDRALYAICRAEPRSAVVAQIEVLARAAASLEDWTGRPMERIDAVQPFADPRIERLRFRVRVAAARHLQDKLLEERLLEEMTASYKDADRELLASLDTWWGRLRYGQGRFREAASLHASAAARTGSVLVKTYSRVSGALALMEAFAFEEARALAGEARALASEHRHAYHEMFATWILRAVDYRTGRADGPDLDLIEAVPFVGGKELEGVIHLNEAAIAWRAGESRVAASLARQSHHALAVIGQDSGVLLARCLSAALGEALTPAEAHDGAARARGALLPGIGVQALALLAIGGQLPRGAVDRAAVDALVASVPRDCWSLRMDILSVEEALAALQPFIE